MIDFYGNGRPTPLSDLLRIYFAKGGGGSSVLKTVTGTLLHILDALAKPAVSFEVGIEPQQDLHGQEAPYPAGGGKNKFDQSDKRAGKVIYGNEAIGAQAQLFDSAATDTYVNIAYLTAGQTYTLSYRMASTAAATGARVGYICDADGKVLQKNISTWSNNATALQINATESGYLWASVDKNATDFQIELGSTATAYAPYENNCPITGWTGVNVYRTGVNLWDEEWEVGDLNASGANTTANDRIRSKNYVPVKSGTTYYIKAPYGIWFWGYDENKAFVQRVPNTSSYNNQTITIPDGIYYLRFVVRSNYGTTYNNDISINYPSTDTDYHAYQGTTIPITFPDAAGTVYGGTLTNNGTGEWELVVEMGINVYNGSENWSLNGAGVFNRNLDGSAKGLAKKGYCNMLPVQTAYNANTKGILLGGSAGDTYMYVCGFQNEITTVEAFKAFISENNLVVCYPLATPIEYTLTDIEALTLLKGENNIWSSIPDGQLSLTYKAKA